MWVIKKAHGKQGNIFENEKTGEQKYFEVVYKSFYGKRRVKKESNGLYQFFDERTGELSEEFLDARAYSDGLARVRKNAQRRWQFLDLNGNLSEEFLEAGDYSDGYAVVRKQGRKIYQFRDVNGNLSEEFEVALNYKYGFARVQNAKGLWQFRDIAGNLSDEYKAINNYTVNGFAKVKIDNFTQVMWRDMLGNLSKVQTRFGKDLADYIFDRKTVYQLCDECFANEKFLQIMIEKEKLNFERFLDVCSTQSQLDEVYDYANDLADYIKGKAYIAYAAEKEPIGKKSIKNNSDVEDFEKSKEEMLTKIEKIF